MKADLESLNGKSQAEAFFLSSGYGWGTTAMFTANAHKALLYYYLTQDKAYLDQAAAQRDYHCGRNNWGVTFTQGLGEVYPEHSHSQLNDLAGLHRGAAVGGPSTSPVGGGTDRFAEFQSNVKYYDRQADYVTNEVAIDYAVHTVFMFMHYAAQASGAVSVRDARAVTLAPAGSWLLTWSPRSSALRLPGALTGPAVLRVVDTRGATLRAFPLSAGALGLIWDGRDAAGRPLAPGVYPLLMTGGTSASGKLILE